MKKNISINISGIIFHIEEDGYDTLRKYLDSINKYFGSFEDSNEILADIESRIAEIFLSRLNDGKQVVTAEDVAALIHTMGNVNDFKAAEEQEFAGGEVPPRTDYKQAFNSDSSTGTSTPKKLMRDQRRKILGGVCAGLAHYFNIDPIWPRLLFALLVLGSYGGALIVYIILWIVLPVSNEIEEEPTIKKMFRDSDHKIVGGVASGIAAYFGADSIVIRILFIGLTFFGGLGVLFYVIFWIALPEAKTITEKMQMQGEPVTLSNIESSVKRGLNEKDGQEESTLAKIILFPFRIIAMVITGVSNALGPVFKVLIDVLRIMVGVSITLLGVGLMIALIMTFGIALGLFHAPHWAVFSDWPIETGGFPIEAFRNSFPIWTIAAAFLTAIIPCLFITLLGNSIIAKKIVFNTYVGWTLFVLFFISAAFLSVNIPRMVFAFKEDGEHKVEQVFDIKGKTMVLKINETGMDEYDVTDLNIRGYDGKEIKLIERFEAQGSSRKVAGENAQMIEYNVAQNDSIITFDSNIKFKKDAKFRAQRLKMELYVPYGMPFVVEESLWRLININGNYYRYHSDNGDETWKITDENGLECITCKTDSGDTHHESSRVDFSPAIGNDEFGLKDFNAVDVRGMFDLKIQRGEKYAVEMVGSEKAKKHYNVSVEGETLLIDYDDDKEFWKRNFSKDSKIKLTITMPSLRELDAKGAGDLKILGFDEEAMEINLMGAVVADGEMNVKNLTVEMTGATQFDLKGEGNSLEADITGACGFKAYGFQTKNARIEAHGASTARVYVTESLEIDKGIASSVSHRGNPNVIREN